MSNFEARQQRIHERVKNLLLTLGRSTDSMPKLIERFENARVKLLVMKPVEFTSNEIITVLMAIALEQEERIEKLERDLEEREARLAKTKEIQ